MSEISITVKLGQRSYPLTVRRDEEERIRKAAKRVNDEINKLRDNYGITDSADLYAMACLEFASLYMSEVENTSKDDGLTQKILSFEKELEQFLKA